VFDLRSYPGLERAAPAFGLSPEELSRFLTEYNPVANAAVLAKAKIPICIIHGDDDQVVPLKENSAALAEIYQTEGAAESIELIIANGQGHNFWQGFFQCQTLVDFAIARARAGVDRAMDR
jgi:pimeloyl-ACP methyl ester carboxylesterase